MMKTHVELYYLYKEKEDIEPLIKILEEFV